MNRKEILKSMLGQIGEEYKPLTLTDIQAEWVINSFINETIDAVEGMTVGQIRSRLAYLFRQSFVGTEKSTDTSVQVVEMLQHLTEQVDVIFGKMDKAVVTCIPESKPIEERMPNQFDQDRWIKVSSIAERNLFEQVENLNQFVLVSNPDEPDAAYSYAGAHHWVKQWEEKIYPNAKVVVPAEEAPTKVITSFAELAQQKVVTPEPVYQVSKQPVYSVDPTSEIIEEAPSNKFHYWKEPGEYKARDLAAPFIICEKNGERKQYVNQVISWLDKKTIGQMERKWLTIMATSAFTNEQVKRIGRKLKMYVKAIKTYGYCVLAMSSTARTSSSKTNEVFLKTLNSYGKFVVVTTDRSGDGRIVVAVPWAIATDLTDNSQYYSKERFMELHENISGIREDERVVYDTVSITDCLSAN